jgi:hypothetical protein
MKDLKRNTFRSLFLIIILFQFSCSDAPGIEFKKKNIHFGGLHRAVLDSGDYTGIHILQAYINEDSCSLGKLNANLYLAENIRTGDTLYIFDLCSKAPEFIKEDLQENFVIMHEKVKKDIPDSVCILVPQSFRIPLRSRFVFSVVTRLID